MRIGIILRVLRLNQIWNKRWTKPVLGQRQMRFDFLYTVQPTLIAYKYLEKFDVEKVV